MAKVAFNKPGTETLVPAPTDIVVNATVTPVPESTVVTPSQPAVVTPSQPAPATPTAPAAPVVPSPQTAPATTQTATAPATAEAPAAPVTQAAPASPAPAVVVSVTPSPVATATLVPAVIPPVGVPATQTNNSGFYDDENISASDLKLPRLNIVQKVGELSNHFQGGTIVLDGSLVLAEAPKANAETGQVRFLVVGLQPKKFVEKVEGGLKGNIFDTEQQVVAKGGTLDYNEAKATQKPLYQHLVTALVFIEQPANLDPNAFPLEFNGKNYVLALYSMKGTSYTNAAKHILTARKMGVCKEGFRFGWWTIASKLKAFGQNASYIPVVRPQEKSTPELRAYLAELLGF